MSGIALASRPMVVLVVVFKLKLWLSATFEKWKVCVLGTEVGLPYHCMVMLCQVASNWSMLC